MRGYDIKCTLPHSGTEITWECKRDRLAQKTGNVAVEHKALLHSRADFFVYLIDGDERLFSIERKRLYGLLKENWKGERLWRVVRGGEYSDYMTLIPVREFIGLCNVI